MQLQLLKSYCYNQHNQPSQIPQLFHTYNQLWFKHLTGTCLQKAIAIARRLRNELGGGASIGLASQATFAAMLTKKAGVCSDYSQVFINFCILNNIKVREWGVVDKWYNPRFGHSFNEIYCIQLKQWVAIDVGKGVVFSTLTNNYRLLSVLALRKYAGRYPHQLQFCSIAQKNLAASTVQHLMHIYGLHVPYYFLVNRYNIYVMDKWLSRFSKPGLLQLAHLWVFLRGQYVQFMFLPRVSGFTARTALSASVPNLRAQRTRL